jgi:fucose 4-O-acetylase-like acetyltransferase
MLKRKKREAPTFLKTANTLTVLVIILATVTVQFGESKVFHRMLFSFHMPMFVLLCGISPMKHKDEGKRGWLIFVRQMALFFVIPYILRALIYSNFSYRNLIWVLYGLWNALDKAQTLTILWFLPCMFVARILVEGILALIPKLPVGRRLGSLIFAAISLRDSSDAAKAKG